jgi:hypothetical protein
MNHLALPLWVFVLHYVGDWRFQTTWMALNKSKNWLALWWHVSVYTSVMIFGAAWFLTPRAAVLFSLITCVTHFITDAITSRLTTRYWFIRATTFVEGGYILNDALRTKFFNTIGIDQMIHYITLAVTLRYLS